MEIKNRFSLGVSILALSLTLVGPRAISGEVDDFDRLDGTGQSAKRVDVIEWENNLEIHVYPGGSLAGLDLKIDDKTNKDKKVMVIGYRFKEAPKQALVRRAILSIPLSHSFKAYRDKSETEFDKIVITNNTLGGELVAYKFGEPSQLFPDGHSALAQKEEPKKDRVPAAAAAPSKDAPAAEVKKTFDEDGGIKPFFMDNR